MLYVHLYLVIFQLFVLSNNKKVLLRERKRHTARKRAQDAEDAEKMQG